jgi:hypothetical protein
MLGRPVFAASTGASAASGASAATATAATAATTAAAPELVTAHDDDHPHEHEKTVHKKSNGKGNGHKTH